MNRASTDLQDFSEKEFRDPSTNRINNTRATSTPLSYEETFCEKRIFLRKECIPLGVSSFSRPIAFPFDGAQFTPPSRDRRDKTFSR